MSSAAHSHLRLVTSTSEAETPATVDRRLHPRLTLSELEWLSSVRLKYGPVVSLIDLSTGGVQIETVNYGLRPGSTVVVQIAGPDNEVAVPSQVLRCFVSGIVPEAKYRSALSFKRAFEPPRAAATGPDAESLTSLIRDHARIGHALRQLSSSSVGFSTEPSRGLKLPSETALTSAFAIMTSPAGQRAGARFRRQLSSIFQALAREIDTGVVPDAMLSNLTERLKRSVPARTIRIVDAGSPVLGHGSHIVHFDVAARNDSTARLVVEFAANARLEDWHMQFLQTAAHLVAVINDVAHMQVAATVRQRLAAPRIAIP
jgi:hypothetical protein